MGLSGPKYAEVLSKDTSGVASGVPIVPAVAAGIATAAASDPPSSVSPVPTARQVGDEDDKHYGSNRHDDGGATGTLAPCETGEAQPAAYRDRWFAAAFVAHLVAVAGTALALGPVAWRRAASREEADAAQDTSLGAATAAAASLPPPEFWCAVVASALVAAPVLSFVACTLMGRNAVGLIQASLWISVALCGLSAAVLLPLAPLAGLFYAVLTVCLVAYARRVRHRIPYAASNLKCGIRVLTANAGLVLVSLASAAGLVGYGLGWAAAFAGTLQLDAMYESGGSDGDGAADAPDLSALGGVLGCLFLLSFYWTHQVLRNCVRATVAGVVGTWWFSPRDAAACCSTAVAGSFARATTYSLGSICFGSLVVAVLNVVRDALRRSQQRNSLLHCVAAFLLAYIEWLVEYFNKWAYIYVGLYGYSYMEAGQRVIALFKARGWETIIADNLVNRLLGITSLAIGLVTGLCSLFAAFLVEEFEAKEGWLGIGFGVGFAMGLLVAGIFMGLLSSAVDGIIVCYAEAPGELEENHPAMAREMSQTWAAAWGEELSGPIVVGLGSGLGVV